MKTKLLPNVNAEPISRLTNKTVQNVLKAWQGVIGTARSVIRSDTIRENLPEADRAAMIRQIDACLEPKGGEVTARANTVELGRQYLELNEEGRRNFFLLLAEQYDPDHEALLTQARILTESTKKAEREKAEAALKQALISPRVTLFRQFNSLPDGFKFLVDMRAEMLEMMKNETVIVPVERDLKDVLAAWFDIGLLDLVEINWRSPAELLEKLVQYEAVHAIRSWQDLKNRVDDDRRIFAFFHNRMEMEPLIFVQVAFAKGLGVSIQEVLDETKPVLDVEKADTALFYSISNAQQGLAGISFGNFLIKRVVGRISEEFPQIKHFATLSPIPGFAKWLGEQLKQKENGLFSAENSRILCDFTQENDAFDALKKILAGKWQNDAETASLLKPILTRLCARYLIREKKGIKAIDPVAHFHLSNGARVEQINWLADTSSKGMKQSLGLMVNYYYQLAEIDENHEDYVSDGKIAASKNVLNLLKGA